MDHIELVNLSSESDEVKLDPRIGGRFWVLADEEGEDADKQSADVSKGWRH